jgi:cystathionine beta-lyase
MFNFDKIVERRGTASVKWDMRKTIFNNENVLPMWVADMDFETPECIVKAVQKRAAHPVYGYSFMEDNYFDAFINWVKRRHQWEIEKEWILFSPGIVTAVNASVMAFSEKGDGVIIQPPVYFPFFDAVSNNERILLNNNLLYVDQSYKIDFDDLEVKAKEAKMILLSSPHNPVCRCWTKEELIRLGKICFENDVIIISDEIHADLILPNFKHIPLASLSDELAEITVTCMAPSKTFNVAGFFTSQVIIKNEKLRERFFKVMEKMHLTYANLFGIVASEAGYSKGDEWVDEMMKYVNGNYELLQNYLLKELPKLKLIKPEATYLAWIDFNELGLTDDEIKNKLIKEASLGLNEGIIFGKNGSGFMRMNLATPRSNVQKALDLLKKAFGA